ncbi:Hypothetical protein CRIB_1800 [Romboutsia ilealis]|jgi:hypothetical protein|uniref:Uncharacterized protein n=1 Tax=Romboutsia ilealis TaxID=1115758 RepID=A0A1V1I2Q7_9FIRM|nr:Hypothetical protein CRIB_1800 [Romboutsia ilealis]
MDIIVDICEIISDLALTLFSGDDWIKIRKCMAKRK